MTTMTDFVDQSGLLFYDFQSHCLIQSGEANESSGTIFRILVSTDEQLMTYQFYKVNIRTDSSGVFNHNYQV